MADNESSHLMWIIIVIAIAALIFMALKLAFPDLIKLVMAKLTSGISDVNFTTK